MSGPARVSVRCLAGLLSGLLAAAPSVADDHCMRTAVVDKTSQAEVRGIEDFSTNRFDGRLYMSSFDRFALEDAVAENADSLPQGAIYAVTRADIRQRPERLDLVDLTADFKKSRDFHPHGIDIHAPVPSTTVMAVINHAYSKPEGGRWAVETAVEIFNIQDEALVHKATITHPRLCRANGIAFYDENTLFVSRDHGACGGFWFGVEDMLGSADAEVLQLDLNEDGRLAREPITVVNNINFANGLMVDHRRNWLFIAATRENVLRVHDLRKVRVGEDPSERVDSFAGFIRMPGSPDNIIRIADGSILIAVHPSLMELGAHRQRWALADWFDKPASRIALISARHSRGEVPTMDVEADLYQAATVAALFGRHTVLGSVIDSGLALCPNEWILRPEGQ